MTSRDAYIALTPEYAEFPASDLPSTSSRRSSWWSKQSFGRTSTRSSLPTDDHPAGEGQTNKRTFRRTAYLDRFLDVVKRNTGLLLIVASQAFGAVMNVCVKMLNNIDPPIPTLELVAVRQFITYLCCITYMLSVGIPDPFLGPKEVRLLLVVRGVVGFLGLFGVYYPLQYLSLSDGTVLTFLAPLSTAMAGSVILGENFKRREAFAGIVSLIGVILIARPAALFGHDSTGTSTEGASIPENASEKGTPRDRLVAVGVALVGVMGFTGAYISIRAIGKSAHPMHVMNVFFAFCVIISTVSMVATRTPWVVVLRWDWLFLLFVITVAGFISQMFLTMGLQREAAGRGSMAIYTQIVFAMILERIFFHTIPSVMSILGSALILASALFISAMNLKEAEGSAPNGENLGLSRLGADAGVEEGLLYSSSDE